MAIPFLSRRFRILFAEPLLGSAPGDPKLFEEWVAARRPEGVDEKEVKAIVPLEDDIKKQMTVFTRTPEGVPCLWDYQMRGFLKAAGRALNRIEGTITKGNKAFLKVITDNIFVYPRMIPLVSPTALTVVQADRIVSGGDGLVSVERAAEDAYVEDRRRARSAEDKSMLKAEKLDIKLDRLTRSLRAQTPQGDRICLACSEMLPSGTYMDIEVRLLDQSKSDFLDELLEYGIYQGLGQWRNGSYGRFTATEIK